MKKLTDEQFNYLHEKYKRLINVAARAVGGDYVTHDVHDCEQELCICMLDAVKGFAKKTGLEPEEFLDSIMFNKYIKTSIWNRKNTLGSKVTKLWNINHSLSIDEELLDLHIDSSGVDCFESVEFDSDEIELINITIQDPTVFKKNGRINISRVARLLSVPKKRILHTVNKIKGRLKEDSE